MHRTSNAIDPKLVERYRAADRKAKAEGCTTQEREMIEGLLAKWRDQHPGIDRAARAADVQEQVRQGERVTVTPPAGASIGERLATAALRWASQVLADEGVGTVDQDDSAGEASHDGDQPSILDSIFGFVGIAPPKPRATAARKPRKPSRKPRTTMSIKEELENYVEAEFVDCEGTDESGTEIPCIEMTIALPVALWKKIAGSKTGPKAFVTFLAEEMEAAEVILDDVSEDVEYVPGGDEDVDDDTDESDEK